MDVVYLILRSHPFLTVVFAMTFQLDVGRQPERSSSANMTAVCIGFILTPWQTGSCSPVGRDVDLENVQRMCT